MVFEPTLHHRRSIRLPGYDYTLPGAYFLTMVTQDRKPTFGRIVNRRMQLSPFGEIVREEWLSTVMHRPRVWLDAFVVMPDHFHAIIVIHDWDTRDDRPVTTDRDVATDRRGTARRAPMVAYIDDPPARRVPIDVADIAGPTARRAPTVACIDNPPARRVPTDVANMGGPTTHEFTVEQFGRLVPGSIPTVIRSFKSAVTRRINEIRGTPGARVWQRNYYERVIRNGAAFLATRAYVINNPVHR